MALRATARAQQIFLNGAAGRRVGMQTRLSQDRNRAALVNITPTAIAAAPKMIAFSNEPPEEVVLVRAIQAA
ncbi:hypothetical protein [Bradyrhizobium australiense]|uniref:Uncharacterized protein n=1 Tax=Bradyrhizobium australiense TaxID=2721161 RepID=A0A7Y4GXW6_9BRAD|nr:hypothetical protein [Bradyrhizobium australiense]NOJ43669.1 hypothetical protein [Bradyrhizobium australiense]